MSKKLMVLWFLIIFLLLGTILVIHYSSLDWNRIDLQRKIKKTSYNYFKDNNLLPSINESSIVYINDLIEKNYIKDTEEIDKYCIESVEVTNKLFINIFTVNRKCSEVLKNEN